MKRFLAIVTTIILLFSTSGMVSAAPLFQDVGDNHYAKAELDFLAAKGIIIFGINRT